MRRGRGAQGVARGGEEGTVLVVDRISSDSTPVANKLNEIVNSEKMLVPSLNTIKYHFYNSSSKFLYNGMHLEELPHTIKSNCQGILLSPSVISVLKDYEKRCELGRILTSLWAPSGGVLKK